VFPFDTAKKTEYFLSHTPLNSVTCSFEYYIRQISFVFYKQWVEWDLMWFIPIVKPFLIHWFWLQLNRLPELELGLTEGVTDGQRMLTPPRHLIILLVYPEVWTCLPCSQICIFYKFYEIDYCSLFMLFYDSTIDNRWISFDNEIEKRIVKTCTDMFTIFIYFPCWSHKETCIFPQRIEFYICFSSTPLFSLDEKYPVFSMHSMYQTSLEFEHLQIL
jgi:hypothetical protein